jgi:hypothetical protein
MDIPLRLAVDFDGVLHDPLNKKKGYKLGQPIPGAPGALQRLKQGGAIIVIHTVWGDTDQKRKAIADWCDYFKIPFDFITNVKPICDLYIDDHGYRFEDWEQTLGFISRLSPQNQSHSSVPD